MSSEPEKFSVIFFIERINMIFRVWGASPREKDYREHYTTREALMVERYCHNELVEWGYES